MTVSPCSSFRKQRRRTVIALAGFAPGGGVSGAGVVFKVDKAGHERVLYSSDLAEGGTPLSGVIRDLSGNPSRIVRAHILTKEAPMRLNATSWLQNAIWSRSEGPLSALVLVLALFLVFGPLVGTQVQAQPPPAKQTPGNAQRAPRQVTRPNAAKAQNAAQATAPEVERIAPQEGGPTAGPSTELDCLVQRLCARSSLVSPSAYDPAPISLVV
jgi:hypothetical protein